MDIEQENSTLSNLAQDMVPEQKNGMQMVKTLHNSKFPVYLVYSHETNTQYALKTFPYNSKGQIHPAYLNEARFKSLSHENLIQILHTEDSQETMTNGNHVQVSFILMEKAHCDFADILESGIIAGDDNIARTFFRNLIEGLEHLHLNRVAHLDLKAENLLLGRDRKLKITDFDLSYLEGDKKLRGRGTKNYRAPELMEEKCTNPFLADIYSAAIILFSLVLGYMPYQENALTDGHNLQELLFKNPEKFWEAHDEISEGDYSLTEDFKELFMAMSKLNPYDRASIAQIKESKWYNGPVYSMEELAIVFKRI